MHFELSDFYDISGTQRNLENIKYKIINIHFPKQKFDIVDAIRWLLQHEYAIGPIQNDENDYIFNQLPEHVVMTEGFTEHKHKILRHGVMFHCLYKAIPPASSSVVYNI
jgi:hypothetical protein